MRTPAKTQVAPGFDAPTAASLRVLVAHGDPVRRRVIRDILTRAAITVVAEATDGLRVPALVRSHRPDVVLLDVAMPSLDGLGVLETISRDSGAQARVVMLSSATDHEVTFLALRRGALGFLDEHVDLAVLPRVVRDVADGKAALSRSFTSHLVERLRDLPEAGIGMRPVQSPLTTREWEVADMLSVGRGTEEMAAAMVLSADTVRTHVKNIMRKLDVHSRADLVEEIEHLRSGLVRV